MSENEKKSELIDTNRQLFKYWDKENINFSCRYRSWYPFILSSSSTNFCYVQLITLHLSSTSSYNANSKPNLIHPISYIKVNIPIKQRPLKSYNICTKRFILPLQMPFGILEAVKSSIRFHAILPRCPYLSKWISRFSRHRATNSSVTGLLSRPRAGITI